MNDTWPISTKAQYNNKKRTVAQENCDLKSATSSAKSKLHCPPNGTSPKKRTSRTFQVMITRRLLMEKTRQNFCHINILRFSTSV